MTTRFFEAHHKSIATIMLLLMLSLGLLSMVNEAGIVDEVAHIPAGYSYLKFGDYRLNPEHGPLLKDLAAVPLLFMHLDFPDTIPAWTTEPNGQWETGWNFIYHIGNDADKILFFSRLPILLLAIVFGVAIYTFTKKRFGTKAALLTLFFYTLSPNILAHSRFVTTDLGIAAFMFFAFYALIVFFERRTWKSLWVATIFFALALLAKFSAILLYPFFILIALIVTITWNKPSADWKQRAKIYLGGLVFIFIVSFFLVWLAYIPHVWNMPLDVQDRLIEASLAYGIGQSVAGILIKLNDLPLFKAIVQYILGAAMVFNRVQGGNTTYFLGQVTNQSFALYFPITWLIKTPVTTVLLTVVAVLTGLINLTRHTTKKLWERTKIFARERFVELFFILFILYYSYLSITGNLNLGIRHLFPIVPLIFLLVALNTVSLFEKTKNSHHHTSLAGGLLILLFWYGLSNLLAFPSYVAYFNEFVGGPSQAYRYVSDSNVDWGQDLIRLRDFTNANPEIRSIAVDYFGGGDPKYYFCDRAFDEQGDLIKDASGYDCSNSKYIPWHAENGVPPTDYIAVSETFLMNDLWWAPRRGDVGYSWLRAQQPVAKIGYSIYVYKVK